MAGSFYLSALILPLQTLKFHAETMKFPQSIGVGQGEPVTVITPMLDLVAHTLTVEIVSDYLEKSDGYSNF